jgi:hypothetical protein
MWKTDPKDKCIHKDNMIIYTFIYGTCL